MDVVQSLSAAIALHRSGRLTEAAGLYEQILAASPDTTDALHFSALIQLQRGDKGSALQRLGRAAALKPGDAALLNDYGAVLRLAGRAAEAEAAFARAVAAKSDYAEAWHNLGLTRRALGQLGGAAEAARRAIALNPGFASAHYALAMVLADMSDLDGAIAAANRAVELNPGFVEGWYVLGNTLRRAGRLDEAAAALDKAVALRADWAPAQTQVAYVAFLRGLLPESIAGFRRALALDPTGVEAGRHLLYAAAVSADETSDSLFATRREFAARHTPAAPAAPHANSRDPDRRLKLGFLSSDLHRHPVGEMIAPLLAARDRAAFAVHVYADIARPDAVTARCREAADSWQDIGGKNDAEIAAHIRGDGIDILVSLAGPFDNNRPIVAAHRPAPVQANLFDMGSSGIAAMDYFLTDAVLNPPDTREKFTESLVRVPNLFIYEPPTARPPAAQPPLAARGHVTFGSFNNPLKLNPRVIALWARVLAATPGARLALKYRHHFAAAAMRTRMLTLFAGAGIEADRLDLLAEDEARDNHLARYDEIDIALDPFPFTGATTTFQALWMGVPVLTLAGDRFAARMSASILAAAGLDELIATTADDYVAKAASMAVDRARLAAYRARFRPLLAASPLCDVPAYARNMEAAFRDMWRRWCAR